jgi:APA family basic amino acid/polyamine antiporter
VGINAVFLMGGDWTQMGKQPDVVAYVAAGNIFGERAAWWMGALIAFGLLSTVNAILWTGAAVLRVIGQDMRALCWLDATDRRGEPVGAVLFMTNLVLILLGTGSFESLVRYIQALLQLCSMMVVIAVVWWRIKKPDMPRPFRIPLYPVPPIIFIAVSAWMLYTMVKAKPTDAIYWGLKPELWGALITLVIGAAIYYLSLLGGGKEPIPAIAASTTEPSLPTPVPPASTTVAPFPVTTQETPKS